MVYESHLFFLVEVSLSYSVVIVHLVYTSDSVIHICISIFCHIVYGYSSYKMLTVVPCGIQKDLVSMLYFFKMFCFV